MCSQELCWQEIVKQRGEEKKYNNQVAKYFLRKKLAGKHCCIKNPVQIRWKSLLLCFLFHPKEREQLSMFSFTSKTSSLAGSHRQTCCDKTFLWLILILYGYHQSRSTLWKVSTETVLFLVSFSYFKHFFPENRSIKQLFPITYKINK